MVGRQSGPINRPVEHYVMADKSGARCTCHRCAPVIRIVALSLRAPDDSVWLAAMRPLIHLFAEGAGSAVGVA